MRKENGESIIINIVDRQAVADGLDALQHMITTSGGLVDTDLVEALHEQLTWIAREEQLVSAGVACSDEAKESLDFAHSIHDALSELESLLPDDRNQLAFSPVQDQMT